MKKIGIITIPDYNNYGNRLQNYAVKTFFEKLGEYEVNTLEMNDIVFTQYQARKIKLYLRRMGLEACENFIHILKGNASKAMRLKKFQEFTKKNLNVKFYPKYTPRVINNLNKEYSYFVIGSDQVWHPYVNQTPTLFFGKFTSPEKRLFFAPSFGSANIPDSYKQKLMDGLSDAENITVREESGSRLIKELTGKEAKILIDPTMMLAKDEWLRVTNIEYMKNHKPYGMEFFLGGKNEEQSEFIKKVIFSGQLEDFSFGNVENDEGYQTGPAEFLGCIFNSEIVFTDSFHCVVFSILFNKPFIIFPRNYNGENRLDDRFDTLLSMCGLKKRSYNLVQDDEWFLHEYKYVYEVLEKKRNNVSTYFCNIME